MRSAVVGATAVITGCAAPEPPKAAPAAASSTPAPAPTPASDLSPDLNVVKKNKGLVMTTIDEFYKVGPGPSSSHTIGPMRITYDFYQRCTKLPADQLAKATSLKVHLYASLSATGKGHGTERAALAGIIGEEAGYVQLPCIERCSYGAVKAWTGFLIASNEIPANRRVDFDTTVNAMALTAREMNTRYKETSEGGLAVSLVLC